MKPSLPALEPDVLTLLAEGQSPVLPPPAVAERLKARILAGVRAQPSPPDPGAGLFTLRALEGEWVSLAPKVDLKLLRQDRESRTYLLRLKPGAVLPAHAHPLDEECYVLEGDLRLGELEVGAGDYHLAPKGVCHGLLRSRGGALLLLRSANPD